MLHINQVLYCSIFDNVITKGTRPHYTSPMTHIRTAHLRHSIHTHTRQPQPSTLPHIPFPPAVQYASPDLPYASSSYHERSARPLCFLSFACSPSLSDPTRSFSSSLKEGSRPQTLYRYRQNRVLLRWRHRGERGRETRGWSLRDKATELRALEPTWACSWPQTSTTLQQ